MQKKLIALAIAGLSSAAFAQTNVTIYGVADGTFDYIKINNALGNPSNSRVTSNGSHLGFKGVENLGNGMNAIFQFETGADFASGSTLGLNRDSFVGLKGGFGQITLGTQTGPTRALGDRLDVNSGDTIMSNTALLGKLGGAYASGIGNAKGSQFDSASTFDTRFKNSIAYVSPSFSGLQATGMYVANENKNATPGSKINTSAYDLGLTYDNGPVFLGTTYARISEKNDTVVVSLLPTPSPFGLNTTAKEFRVGGMYDFGMATVRALYARTKADGSFGNAKQNVWGIGGTFNVSPNGKLVAQYYKAKDMSGSILAANGKTGAKFYTLGYEHSLSKRTMLKAGYAYLKNDSAVAANGGYDFGYNSVGLGGASANNVKLSGFQFGIRHAF